MLHLLSRRISALPAFSRSFSFSGAGWRRSLPTALWLLTCSLMSIAGMTACGEPGAPQPPSLNLPVPVRDLSATRSGNTVHLAWKSTNRTTDHTAVSGTVRTHICRMEGSGPCELITDLPLAIGKLSQFDDTLPTDQLQGAPQLLTYYVELFNHGRKSAGRSDPAYSANGQATPDLSSLRATVRPEGVELDWDPVAWPSEGRPGETGHGLVRIVRVDQTPASPKPTASSKMSFANHDAPLEMLEVPADSVSANSKVTLGRAIDRTARFGQSYRYQAQCVEKLTIDGHPIEIVGALSSPAVIFTRDTFPPAVPQQLAAAADPATHAIDLSWSPDSEPDLAGYIVYRADPVGPGWEKAHRISGDAPLPTPAFHDAQVQAGVNYAYTVTAIDQSGNQSKPSDMDVETLTP